jgi:glucokinase
MLALALDIGGSHFSCAVVSDEKILSQREGRIAPQSFRAVLPCLEQVAAETAAQAGMELRSCSGLVLGFPGIVDSRETTVVATNAKFNDAIGFDLSGWSKEKLGLPLFVENDARLALLGEQWRGAAQGVEDAVLVTLGTGIGAAAMVDGRLLRGRFDQAGCLGGHLPVVLNGRRCTCGNIGCAEAEASTWALPQICREWPGFDKSRLSSRRSIDFAALFAAFDAGDALAQAVVRRCCDVWAALTVGLIHAYSPATVVFGGGIMARAKEILPAIRKHVEQHAWTPRGHVEITAARLESAAPLYGAIPFLLEIAR